jgi:ketosteroid isomerase-like protein
MSQENVEIVRGLHEAFARGDNDTPFSVYDPEIEWDMTRLPLPGEESVYHGHDGVRRYWRAWLEPWEFIDAPIERFVEAGHNVVTLFGPMTGRGKRSGVEVEFPPLGAGLDIARRKSGLHAGLSGPRRSPRSRRAVGVAALDEKQRFAWKAAPCREILSERRRRGTWRSCAEDSLPRRAPRLNGYRLPAVTIWRLRPGRGPAFVALLQGPFRRQRV